MSYKNITLRATTKLRNELLVSARERLELNQKKAAELSKVPFEFYCRLEKLDFPKKYNFDYVFRISTSFSISPDDIWPEELIGVTIPNEFISVGKIKIPLLLDYINRQRERLLLPSPADSTEKSDAFNDIAKNLHCLTFREQEVIKLRYGFDDGITHTLEECGRIYGAGKERIRQIESKAITKLRRAIIKKEETYK